MKRKLEGSVGKTWNFGAAWKMPGNAKIGNGGKSPENHEVWLSLAWGVEETEAEANAGRKPCPKKKLELFAGIGWYGRG